MNYEKARNFLGLCARARKVTAGSDAVLRLMGKGRADIVVLDAEMAENGQKRILDKARTNDVPVFFLPELGRAIGRESAMVAAVSGDMAKRLTELLKQESANDMNSREG